MLNLQPAINDQKKFSNIELKEISPIRKLIIRGKSRKFISAVGRAINILLPTEANTSSSNGEITTIWLSPDEWLIFSNTIDDKDFNQIEEKLIQNICKTKLGAVIDVTDQFVMINLSGNKIFDLFQTGSPFNFNEFRNKKGVTTQTLLAKIDVIIQNKDQNDANLFVRRSFSRHLFSWMSDSASRL
ncbi:sarcosine oxidase subunit gamma [Candidatus Pelagibacter sp. HIMB1321]|uniref:sarcosine oxidase subunit gamma n=1 Tax=Candidatus Pelagibacter sp. HIMB1321 TaxID=1388755 RepID=UPI000A07EC83|nr:sarcosine oxidase subunit gamma family protein [Candidatus Pelagibacter sp. HIMB1321]SMF75868.1 sarcosine oxidase subunit gamma [Candidatus Pelagibacter sp. HIMB1321]